MKKKKKKKKVCFRFSTPQIEGRDSLSKLDADVIERSGALEKE